MRGLPKYLFLIPLIYFESGAYHRKFFFLFLLILLNFIILNIPFLFFIFCRFFFDFGFIIFFGILIFFYDLLFVAVFLNSFIPAPLRIITLYGIFLITIFANIICFFLLLQEHILLCLGEKLTSKEKLTVIIFVII